MARAVYARLTTDDGGVVYSHQHKSWAIMLPALDMMVFNDLHLSEDGLVHLINETLVSTGSPMA